MTDDQIDKWAVKHIVLTQGVEATREAARALLKEAGLGAPSFKAQQIRLTQFANKARKIILTVELDAIEPATEYMITPINPAVVREKSGEQLWREAAEKLEMANVELSRAYPELKRQQVIDSSCTRRDVIVPLTEPVSIAKAMLGGREAKAETAVGGEVAAFLVNIQLTPWNGSAQYAAGYAGGFNRGAKAMLEALATQTPTAWRDPKNSDPGQAVTFKKEDHDKWPHIFREPLFAHAQGGHFAIPKGWNLVPDLMTAKMINEWVGGPAVSSDSVAVRTSFQEGWKRVLASAPKYKISCAECKDTGYGPDGSHCMACSEPATAQAIYQVGTQISNGIVWSDIPGGLFKDKAKENYSLLRTVYDMPPPEVKKAFSDPSAVAYASLPDAIAYTWGMYQDGKGSADHTDQEVFTRSLQSFSDWFAARVEVERLKNGG